MSNPQVPPQRDEGLKYTEDPRVTSGSSGNSQTITEGPAASPDSTHHKHRGQLAKYLLIGLLSVGIFMGAFAIGVQRNEHLATKRLDDFATQNIDLSDLVPTNPKPDTDNSLVINGSLGLNGSIAFTPSTKPLTPKEGELYYEKNTNQLGYFDGKGFVYLQGGAASSVTNNYSIAGNTYIDGDTVNYFTSINGGISAASSTAGRLALFTNENTIGDSVVSQSGASLVAGSSSSDATTTLQGGDGGIYLLTGNRVGVSGNIDIRSGESSTTASGNVTIDTGVGVITGVQVGAKDFEASTGNLVPCFGYTDTLVQSTNQAQNGTHSLRVAVGSPPNTCIDDAEPYQMVSVVPGHTYAFSIWFRSESTPTTWTASAKFSSTGYGGAGIVAQTAWGTITTTTSEWSRLTGTLIAPAGSNFVGLRLFSGSMSAPGEIHYIDGYTVTDLSSSSSISAVKLGDTNAQSVTIGNLGQIDATSIRGSGVNINGGLGNMSITGGTLTATTSGATYSTTSGPLNITAAASSTWRIAASGGAGGSLTIQSGNAGGDGTGGNLAIFSGSGSGTGASGDIELSTADSSVLSGSLSISTGDSSTTASGDITIDTGSGIIDGELVGQKTFESGTDNMADWFNTTVSATTEQARSGSQSLKVEQSSNFWGIGENQNFPGTPAIAGHQYYISAWVRAATTPRSKNLVVEWHGGGGTLALTPVTNSTTDWTQISGTGIAPAGTTEIYLRSSGSAGAVGEVHYFDDIEIIDLSSASAASSINIGTTNAKIINIGNLNQISPVSIQGGSGISINGGAGNIDISGGALSLTAGAASTISTSQGALTITSAEAATWSIAASSTGDGGSLTLRAGSAYASGDTNGGNVILQGGTQNGAGTVGSVIVRSAASDATLAFQIQNSSGTYALLTADTTNRTITVSGAVGAYASLVLSNAHFSSTQTTAPTIGTPASCGTTPTASVAPASTDSAGSFVITTGTGGTSSTCDTTITFDSAYTTAPKSIIVVGKADAASAQRQIFVDSETATSFTVSFANSAAGADSTSYEFSYWIIE